MVLNKRTASTLSKLKGFRNKKQTVTNHRMIAELEKRYSQFKNSIDGYKDEEDEIWLSLNEPFSSDLDKLGVALKDYFRDNKK